MVYLEKIELLKKKTLNNEISQYYFNYIKGIENVIVGDEKLTVKRLALHGYSNKVVDIETVNNILNQNAELYKGNTYELLGIYLLMPSDVTIQNDIEEKYSQVDVKLKFIIAKIIDKYKIKLLGELKSKKELTSEEIIIKYIIEEKFYSIDAVKYAEYIENADDFNDLIILDSFAHKKSLSDISSGTPKDNIVNILNNFYNANKKITKGRRKDHNSYEINDEYDVQDLLYVIFKTLYPSTTISEENTPKVAGKTARADFIFKDFKIVLEIKMIKESDSNETKFIEQLKVDIESYYRSNPKYMIFYIYDPMDKTNDEQSFKDLEGTRKYKDKNSDEEIETEIIVIRGH